VRQHFEGPPSDSAARVHNLPSPRTELVGRERERSSARELLLKSDVRLVTLVGLGGCGKTRLAIQVAGDVVDRFPGGVYFVGLASATDPGTVASVIAQALNIPLNSGRSFIQDLTAYVKSAPRRPTLLFLDNFEQVLSAAPLMAELLDAWPALKMLVTSRAPLRVRGENECRVRPLALPERGALTSVEQFGESPAVALFLQRARAAAADFASSEDNVRAWPRFAPRLDGLPLAIELAAARTKLFFTGCDAGAAEQSPPARHAWSARRAGTSSDAAAHAGLKSRIAHAIRIRAARPSSSLSRHHNS
jgi:predicted ATPase